MNTQHSGPHPQGRCAKDARARILAAARRRFAEHGLHATPLRVVAADAGVDVALISHYYGSKFGLFAASMALPELARTVVTDALAVRPKLRGEVLTRDFLQLWEDPETAGAIRVVALAARTEPDARSVMRHVMAGGDLDSPELRALTPEQTTSLAVAMSHLLGVAKAKYLLRSSVLEDVSPEELVERVAPAVPLELGDLRRGGPAVAPGTPARAVPVGPVVKAVPVVSVRPRAARRATAERRLTPAGRRAPVRPSAQPRCSITSVSAWAVCGNMSNTRARASR